MTESKREYLNSYEHKYVSIGINKGAQHISGGWAPWDSMANCFNMRTPRVFFDAEELQDPEVWQWLESKKVNGCYIFCPLEDYSFLSRLTHLEDITIHKGGALRDLGFLRSLPDWFQLHIEDAVLEDLGDLFPDGIRKGIHSYCVCLSGCAVKDISALCRPEIWLSELVILAPEGSNDKERWKAIRCGKYSYYEYRVKEK